MKSILIFFLSLLFVSTTAQTINSTKNLLSGKWIFVSFQPIRPVKNDSAIVRTDKMYKGAIFIFTEDGAFYLQQKGGPKSMNKELHYSLPTASLIKFGPDNGPGELIQIMEINKKTMLLNRGKGAPFLLLKKLS